MAAPSLQPLDIQDPIGTPAAEWAQQTVEAIDPNASTGVVTDSSGNPTTDHAKSALEGEPGHGVNSDKTAGVLEAQRSTHQPSANGNAHEASDDATTPTAEMPRMRPTPRLSTVVQGNLTTNALPETPGGAGPIPSANTSVASTPGAQLPGGWIRGPESRTQSIIVPETSLYEDVSAALGTVGQAAFSVLPASVVGTLSHNHEQGESNGHANHAQASAPASDEIKETPSPPPRSGSPGILSRAQGMLTGLLARPASPSAKLPVPDAPTTSGEAALVGGGAVAETANKLGDNIAASQDLGEHDPKDVLEDDQAKLEKESAGRTVPTESANTAAMFINPDVPTPDPSEPPQDPGLSGSVFPTLPDEGKDKSKAKGRLLGTTLSPDRDVQEAASKSNQDFSVPIPGATVEDSKSSSSPSASKPQPASEDDRSQPTVTKVSDSGVKAKLLDVKDVVTSPFAGSRAPPDSGELASSPSAGNDYKSSIPIDQSTKASANPEGIRTTANPHTPHTNLPPPKEEAGDLHVGGTNVLTSSTTEESKDMSQANGGNQEASGENAAWGVPIRGVSSRGSGQGVIYASHDGRISMRSEPHAAATDATTAPASPPGSPSKGLSRLWSRHRKSVDEGRNGARTSEDANAAKPTRSRFSEQEPSNESSSSSGPTSPTSTRFKVPLKDKIKGEFKIISGKVSRNETKVEQGIALKTGHAHEEPVSPTTQKH